MPPKQTLGKEVTAHLVHLPGAVSIQDRDRVGELLAEWATCSPIARVHGAGVLWCFGAWCLWLLGSCSPCWCILPVLCGVLVLGVEGSLALVWRACALRRCRAVLVCSMSMAPWLLFTVLGHRAGVVCCSCVWCPWLLGSHSPFVLWCAYACGMFVPEYAEPNDPCTCGSVFLEAHVDDGDAQLRPIQALPSPLGANWANKRQPRSRCVLQPPVGVHRGKGTPCGFGRT